MHKRQGLLYEPPVMSVSLLHINKSQACTVIYGFSNERELFLHALSTLDVPSM